MARHLKVHKAHAPAEGQLELGPLTREERFRRIREARLTIAGVSERRIGKVYRLLEMIEVLTYPTECRRSVEMICAKLRMKPTAVREAIAMAEELKVLEVDRTPDPGGQGMNRYTIDYQKLRTYGPGGQSQAVESRESAESGPPSVIRSAPSDERRAHTKEVIPEDIPEDLPPPPSSPAPTSDERAVVAELGKCGIAIKQKLAGELRKHGIGDDQVAAVCEVWRSHPGRWGVGALVDRLRNIAPGDDPRDMSAWPPSPAWDAAQAKLEQLRQRHASDQADAARETAAANERRDREQLLATMAPRIEGLDAASLEALVGFVTGGSRMLRQLIRKRGVTAGLLAPWSYAKTAEWFRRMDGEGATQCGSQTETESNRTADSSRCSASSSDAGGAIES